VSAIDDALIHEIVQRVLGRITGAAQPPPAPVQTQAPAPPPTAPPASTAKVVAIGADHGGFDLKELLKPDIAGMGYEIKDVGSDNRDPVDYPDPAAAVAKLVGTGAAWRGIIIDGAGIGSCMAANKVPGVRAGLAHDLSSAVNGREHNDANVLTLGAGLTGPALARQIVKAWLAAEFGGGRHAPRVAKITAIERLYLKS
jgi:ribose 5-phosphate isomerase B